MLAKLLAATWWVLLLRGILAILFGVAAYAWPGMTLATLVLFFAAFVLVDGVFDVFAAFAGRKENENWWVLLIEGLLGIAFGAITWMRPDITTMVLLLFIAFWAMATGILRIIMALRLRKEIEGEWWLVLSGLASVLFGLVVMARPGAGAIAMLWLIAAWAVVVGVFLVILAFQARSFGKRLEEVREKVVDAGAS
jgi:uncharacterized membrane protein HdeD (DUF308 family)